MNGDCKYINKILSAVSKSPTVQKRIERMNRAVQEWSSHGAPIGNADSRRDRSLPGSMPQDPSPTLSSRPIWLTGWREQYRHECMSGGSILELGRVREQHILEVISPTYLQIASCLGYTIAE